MSGDVGEIENSITSSLDLLLKNPILILLLFLDTYYHQLAADLVYCSGASRNGLVDGESRQKTETSVFGSSGQME